MTLFSISQAIRNAGGLIWHIDFDQPFGVVFRAESGRNQFRVVKLKQGSSPKDVSEEMSSITHVVTDAENLECFLSQKIKCSQSGRAVSI